MPLPSLLNAHTRAGKWTFRLLEALFFLGFAFSLRLVWSVVPSWVLERPEFPSLLDSWPFAVLGFTAFLLWIRKRRGGDWQLLRRSHLELVERQMNRLCRIPVLWALAAILVCIFLIGLLRNTGPRHGLLFQAYDGDRPHQVRCSGISSTGDLNASSVRRRLPGSRRIAVTWEGYLFVPRDATPALKLRSDGTSSLLVDDVEAVAVRSMWKPDVSSAAIPLSQGSHSVSVEYSDEDLFSVVQVQWDLSGEMKPISHRHLTVSPQTRLHYQAYRLKRILTWILSLSALLLGVRLISPVLSSAAASSSTWKRGVIAILGVAVALRLGVVVVTRAMLMADEAIVVIMAQNIAGGRDFPLMYYGQDYNGALLAYLQAPFIAAIPDPLWAAKIVSVLLSCLFLILAVLFARRFAGPLASFWTGLLLALPPVTILLLGLSSLVGPTEVACVGMLLLLRIPVLLESPRPSKCETLGLGVLAGLALWGSFQALYFLVPLALCGLWRIRNTGRLALWFLPGFLLGSIPLLLYNWGAWPPPTLVQMSRSKVPSLDVIFWSRLIMENLGVFLGGRPRYDRFRDIAPPALTLAVLGILTAAWLWLLLAGRRTERSRANIDASRIVLLFFPIGLAFFCFSRYGLYGPRHLYSVLLMVPVLAGIFLGRLGCGLPHLATLLGLIMLLLQVWGIGASEPFLYFQPMHYLDQGKTLPLRNDELLAGLRSAEVDAVNSDYWIAAPLTAESQQRLIADSFGRRYPKHHRHFLDASRVGYVLHPNEPEAELILAFLRQSGFAVKRIGIYAVAVPLSDSLPRSRWKARSHWSPAVAAYAADGDLTPGSVWNAPPRRNNWIEIRFDEPVVADRISVYEGATSKRNFSAKSPVPVRLEALQNGTWVALGIMRTDPHLAAHFAEFSPMTVSGFRLTNGRGRRTSQWSIRDIFIHPASVVGDSPAE